MVAGGNDSAFASAQPIDPGMSGSSVMWSGQALVGCIPSSGGPAPRWRIAIVAVRSAGDARLGYLASVHHDACAILARPTATPAPRARPFDQPRTVSARWLSGCLPSGSQLQTALGPRAERIAARRVRLVRDGGRRRGEVMRQRRGPHPPCADLDRSGCGVVTCRGRAPSRPNQLANGPRGRANRCAMASQSA